MSGAIKNPLRSAIFESVAVELEASGIVLQRSAEQFIRQRGDVTDRFSLACLNEKPGYRIQPNVAVRFESVEKIFHEVSGMQRKYQKNTPTLGGGVGNIFYNDNRCCEFRLIAESDIPSVTENIVHIFKEFALPYFDRYSSLSAVDHELNDKPSMHTPNRSTMWLRCSTGTIVAKLTSRGNYDQLISIYSALLSTTDKGFFLKYYEKLLKVLENVQPE